MAKDVQRELREQAQTLPRQGPVGEVLAKGTLLVVVANLKDGITLCNDFAPSTLSYASSSLRSGLAS